MTMTTTEAGTDTASSEPATERTSADPPWRPGFRARVLGLLALLLALGLGAGLLIQRAILYEHLNRTVDNSHDRHTSELEKLVGGRDPRTGEPFRGDVEAIFDTFLSRNLPGTDEAFLTLIDGEVHGRVPGEATVSTPELRAELADLESGARGVFESDRGTVRWLATPLQGEQGTEGVFVVGTFVDDQQRDIESSIRFEAMISLVVLLVSLGVAWVLAGRLLRPVRELTDNARQISESDLSARIPVEGNDEIAQLTRTYNAMLDRLQEAFQTQRRFIDSAGHELRTPITIVRGHLELMGEDPEERRETVELVTDELDRMSRMVDDLLLLAKSEQPDFIVRAPVDADDLTTGLVDRARAVGDRNWVVDSVAEGYLEADQQRLTQAALNLIRNAVEHTRPGDEIGIGTEWALGNLRINVRDHGPGVPEADRERIFERFSRGASGQRRSEGAGLGLSIVRAIAVAHGGTASVASTPGVGSVFTITVPAGPADAHPGVVAVGEPDPAEPADHAPAGGPTTASPGDPTVVSTPADPTVVVPGGNDGPIAPDDPTREIDVEETQWPGS